MAKAIGTAQRGTNRVASSQPTRIGATAHGSAASPWTGARQSVSTTPASIACASAVGIAATRRPSAGQRPVIRISTPTSRKAPTAADQPPATAPVVANMAAPGVDQARIRGVRCRRVSHRMPSPWARLSTSSPEAAWAGVAPTARRPASTTANELVKPTRAATIPAITGRDTCSTDRTLTAAVFCLQNTRT